VKLSSRRVSALDTGVEDVVAVDLNGLESFIDRAFKALLHMQQIADVVRTVLSVFLEHTLLTELKNSNLGMITCDTRTWK